MKCGFKKRDYFFISLLFIVGTSYLLHLFFGWVDFGSAFNKFIQTQYDVVGQVWIGVIISVLFVGLIHKLPDELVLKLFGKSGSFKGMLKAAFAGFFLDLCSHGILMVAMMLYKRGVSLGQIVCFLVASPWNSFSITIILTSLIGIFWTIIFVLLSLVVAIIGGLIFDRLVQNKVLPINPNNLAHTNTFNFSYLIRNMFKQNFFSLVALKQIIFQGIKNSKIVVKWLCFGIVLSGVLNTVLTDAHIGEFFAPTMLGLGITIGLATVLEVCSEGLAPIAADIFNKGKAIGNTFAFLMCGVATDYTEIMVVKETTGSWKISLFLPLVLVPQIVVFAVILNQM